MTSIAAIVCGHTLDRWHDIQQSIGSLRTQTRPADQIIFSVDNNADLYAAARAAFPDITVVQNTGTRGVSGTRNVAAHAASCDVIAFLDDDATADNEWIERLLPWYHDADTVGVGGTANPAWDGRGPAWFPASFNWVVGCSHSGIADKPAPVRNFIGCNMSIRRSAWQAVGGFDESIGRVGADGGGGDETDFCMRVTDVVGGTIMNDPAAVVTHRVPTSRQTLAYFVKRCRSEGRSKAQISARAGADQALSEERNHLLTELPRSFFAGIVDAVKGDVAGIARSGAIVIGTAATGIGFIAGSFRRPFASRSETALGSASGDSYPGFAPVTVVTVDLDQPTAIDPSVEGRPSFVVIRRGSQLLGTETFDQTPSSNMLFADLHGRYPKSQDPARGASGTSASRTAAVVIATRDRTDSLKRCLLSVIEMSVRPHQIIVVDNAPSSTETEAMVTEWNRGDDPPIVYVRCDKAGLANAHNAALPHVTADVVALTDDDVLADPHWLAMLLAGFEAGRNVACVTGAILPAELETWPQTWVESTSNFTKGFDTTLFSAASPPDDPLFPFTAGSMGSGANMAFDTAWLRQNGGFDGALGAGTTALGGDDLRAFYDVIADGQQLYFTPDAIVFHHHHRTPEAIARQAHGYGAGLGAFLMSVVAQKPATLVAMIRRAPGAIRHARSVTSPPAEGSFPGDQQRSRGQRAGMLGGPLRYLRSRRH